MKADIFRAPTIFKNLETAKAKSEELNRLYKNTEYKPVPFYNSNRYKIKAFARKSGEYMHTFSA